jgi:hypothetical protein
MPGGHDRNAARETRGGAGILDRAEGETMIKAAKSAEQQLADEASLRALHPLTSRQKISESQAAPEFEKNHQRLRAERLAREAGLRTKGK